MIFEFELPKNIYRSWSFYPLTSYSKSFQNHKGSKLLCMTLHKPFTYNYVSHWKYGLFHRKKVWEIFFREKKTPDWCSALFSKAAKITVCKWSWAKISSFKSNYYWKKFWKVVQQENEHADMNTEPFIVVVDIKKQCTAWIEACQVYLIESQDFSSFFFIDTKVDERMFFWGSKHCT